jgi:hypothetical protein
MGTLEVGGTAQHSVYLGLSATAPQQKNSGEVRRLYRRFIEDARAWEVEHNERLLLWYTTATPSACFAAFNLFDDAEPRLDGSVTAAGVVAADGIRQTLGVPRLPGEHPFVLRD